MDEYLVSIATPEALELLTSELRFGEFRYALIGSDSANDANLENVLKTARKYDDIKKHIKHYDKCNVYSDNAGVISYEVDISAGADFSFYTYAIAILKMNKDATGVSMLTSLTNIPKTMFIKQIGGHFVIKTNVKTAKAEILFNDKASGISANMLKIAQLEIIKPILEVLNNQIEQNLTLKKQGVI